jgi:hypothetical protein
MPHYFMLFDPDLLQGQIIPALSASWREHSFAPCLDLCTRLTSAAQTFAAKYHVGSAEPMLSLLQRGIGFDRRYWQLLVGEVLLFAAEEIPEIQVSPSTMCYLLAPEFSEDSITPRHDWPWIRKAHFGSLDLRFGTCIYRSEFSGFNDLRDVKSLNDFLTSIAPMEWQPDDLLGCPGIAPDEAAEELDLLREWFPQLRDLYAHADKRHRSVVCEVL